MCELMLIHGQFTNLEDIRRYLRVIRNSYSNLKEQFYAVESKINKRIGAYNLYAF